MNARRTRRSGHFSPELFTFLRQLERNNNRAWFEKNRDRYIELGRDPMLEFIEDLAPRLLAISKRLVVDPRPVGGSMFRIYRDVRFSKDKRPYKTAVTARFPHDAGKNVHVPGYYLHLGTDGVYMASGIWHPDAAALLKIRKAIVRGPEKWKKSLPRKALAKTHALTGDTLQRPPRGFDADHPRIEDLKRKDYITVASLDERAACAPDFLGVFAKLCRETEPFVRFHAEALGLRW